jgi:hypothetical protein
VNASSRRFRIVIISLGAVVALLVTVFAASELLSRPNSQHPAQSNAGSQAAVSDTQPATTTVRPILFGPFDAHIVGGASPSDFAWTQDLLTGDTPSGLSVVQPHLDSSMSMSGVRVLDDGTFVVVASQDLTPGVDRPDGPSAQGLAFPLMHLSVSGDILTSRDIRVPGELVSLVGASGNSAYVVRSPSDQASDGGRLVSIDLSSGQEQVVATGLSQPTAGDVRSGDIALGFGPSVGTATGRACSIWRLDSGTDAPSTAEIPSCESVLSLQISPDGSEVGVAYAALTNGANEILATTWSGRQGDALSTSTHIGYVEPYGDPAKICRAGCPSESPIDFAGIAWKSDSRSLQVGVIQHPSSGIIGDVRLPDDLRVMDVAVR